MAKEKNTIVDRCRGQVEPVLNLVAARSEEYDSGGVDIDDYWLYGLFSLNHEIHKKALRLRSVLSATATVPSKEQQAKMKDSLHDLVAYSLFMLDYMERKL
jgi:hypothetical protein